MVAEEFISVENQNSSGGSNAAGGKAICPCKGNLPNSALCIGRVNVAVVSGVVDAAAAEAKALDTRRLPEMARVPSASGGGVVCDNAAVESADEDGLSWSLSRLLFGPGLGSGRGNSPTEASSQMTSLRVYFSNDHSIEKNGCVP